MNSLSQRKIYFSLTAILVPVFVLVVFVQSAITRPLLEEEVKNLGISIARSLATDIKASRLLNKPRTLEDQLIEISWTQTNVVRLDVIVPEGDTYKVLATNINIPPAVDGENPQAEPSLFDSDLMSYLKRTFDEKDPRRDIPKTVLEEDHGPRTWRIFFPVRDRQDRTQAVINLELSLYLVDQVVSTFVKIAVLGMLLSLALLIGLLSRYIRRMMATEHQNVLLSKQLVEAHRELYENEKLAVMGSLTASFAHEIGTPLNSLSGHVQLLKEDTGDNQVLQRIDVIDSQITRIEKIVRGFLDSTHTPRKQKQLVDIREVYKNMLELISPRMLKLQVKGEIDIEGNLPLLRIVPGDLEQVILNLSNNALDAIEAKQAGTGALKFSARSVGHQSQSQIELSISDTGEGIAPDALKNILKPFYTTKPHGKGTGLGLTICQEIIKQNGGRLEIQSELGKGTRVLVTFPLV